MVRLRNSTDMTGGLKWSGRSGRLDPTDGDSDTTPVSTRVPLCHGLSVTLKSVVYGGSYTSYSVMCSRVSFDGS